MKRTILAVMMAVMIATPCFSQEIEPDGLFSIEGTLWKALPIGVQIFPLPGIWDTEDLQFGFFGGEVYPDLEPDDSSFYIDMLAFSIFSTTGCWISTNQGGTGGFPTNYYGILQPSGIGMVVEVFESYYLFPDISIALLIKADDKWSPPGVE
jgi:hypothetical protein